MEYVNYVTFDYLSTKGNFSIQCTNNTVRVIYHACPYFIIVYLLVQQSTWEVVICVKCSGLLFF